MINITLLIALVVIIARVLQAFTNMNLFKTKLPIIVMFFLLGVGSFIIWLSIYYRHKLPDVGTVLVVYGLGAWSLFDLRRVWDKYYTPKHPNDSYKNHNVTKLSSVKTSANLQRSHYFDRLNIARRRSDSSK